MKTFFKIIQYTFLSAAFLFQFDISQAQNTKAQKKQEKLDAVKKMVNNQNYVFKAQMALPLGWRNVQLNYDYNVVVSKDSIDSYLPYYGRAYVAPYNSNDPTETGIQFKSKNFEYKDNLAKKSGWEVTIVPHDVKETRSFILNISETGYATLSVNSNNRQSISFNGYITENVPKDKK